MTKNEADNTGGYTNKSDQELYAAGIIGSLEESVGTEAELEAEAAYYDKKKLETIAGEMSIYLDNSVESQITRALDTGRAALVIEDETGIRRVKKLNPFTMHFVKKIDGQWVFGELEGK